MYFFAKQDTNEELREQRILNRIVASIYGSFRELKLD